MNGKDRPPRNGAYALVLKLPLRRNNAHYLLIRKASLGLDYRLRERPPNHLARFVKRHEDGKRKPILVRDERADAVAKLVRQHRQNAVSKIDTRRSPCRFAVDCASWPYEMRNICDMDAKHCIATPIPIKRKRIVVITRRHRIAGKNKLFAQIKPFARLLKKF